MSDTATTKKPEKVNFGSDQDVRWCPGCGDYAILAQMKRVLPELGIPKEKFVFVSGIGCSSRFPYYLDTYGFHTIHGRAPTVATGVKLANPDLSVWIVTGDGDGLSIGGNHLMHLCRRNVDVNVLLFNNQIYGLTKGQYSPTSPVGKVTKTTPYGSLDTPFDPLSLVLSAGATFVARTMDRDTKHMAETFRRAAAHKGCSFVEIYQNCNIYNDGAFFSLTDIATRPENVVYLEDGEPLLYGKEKEFGVCMNGMSIESKKLNGKLSREGVITHSESDHAALYPQLLAQMAADISLPTPVGVFRALERPTYNEMFHEQIDAVTEEKGSGDIKTLLTAGETWQVD